ncbi:MAG: hypothetical protein M3362_00310, partial [Acidobacteriota bacterium]|nr:hypothetical protein [Acidobacteriota bacterium]
MNQLIGAGFEPYLATRAKDGQSEVEYYNPQNGLGFQRPEDLVNYLQPYAPNVNKDNVFDVVKAGYTPLNTPAPSPTDTLNQAQQSAFNQIKTLPVADPNALKDTASQIIGNNVADIQTQAKNVQQKQDELLGQITSFMAPSDTEKDLTTQLNNLDTSYEMGDNAIQDKVIPMEEITGMQDALSRQYNAKRNALTRQLLSETTSRQQKLDAATFLYNATRNSLADTITLYNATKPENLGTYTKDNGDMYATFRNPIT